MNDVMNEYLKLHKIISNYMDYVGEASYFEVQNTNGKVSIIDIENIFDDKIPMEIICLKIIHKVLFANIFSTNFMIQNNIINPQNSRDNTYIYLELTHEVANILKRKGFGLFTYNVDDMAYILKETPYAIINYIKSLHFKNKDKKILDELFSIIYDLMKLDNVDMAMITFINGNKDLFENYLEDDV